MFSTALPTEIRGGVCTGPAKAKEDGATARGPGRVTIISDRVFDFRDYPTARQDEVISGVDGASVRLQRCVILGGIKAVLAGNGDHPGNDMRFGHWEMEDCVIMQQSPTSFQRVDAAGNWKRETSADINESSLARTVKAENYAADLGSETRSVAAHSTESVGSCKTIEAGTVLTMQPFANDCRLIAHIPAYLLGIIYLIF